MDRILINAGPSERGWHRLETFLICPQRFAYRYLLNLEGSSAVALGLGSLVHVGTAHLYAQMRAVQRGEDPGRYYNPEDAIRRAAEAGKIESGTVDRALVTFRAYCQHYAHEKIKPVMIEEQVRASLDGRHPITQRWDLAVEDASGLFWVWDTKTAAKVSSALVNRYALSGQFILAHLIGRATWGNKFGGVKLNAVQTTPPYTCLRTPLPAAPMALTQFGRRMAEIEDRIAALAAENRDPWEYPKAYNEHACMTAYGPCAFEQLCRWGNISSDEQYLRQIGASR